MTLNALAKINGCSVPVGCDGSADAKLIDTRHPTIWRAGNTYVQLLGSRLEVVDGLPAKRPGGVLS